MEEFEGKRITEENRIFNEETKLAGEFKAQTGKLNAQINRLDSAYRKTMSQLMKAKNSIQVSELLSHFFFWFIEKDSFLFRSKIQSESIQLF